MKDLIETIVRAIVDNPDEVQVTEINGANTIVIELHVAPSDLGKVIGKQGRTARSMRALLAAAATRDNKRAVLEILE